MKGFIPLHVENVPVFVFLDKPIEVTKSVCIKIIF
jgi:hypothetical protein